MAFGQQSGPPASAKQVAEITELLERAGYASLREARHPFGLTQRQAGGKFSRSEADELIAKLLETGTNSPETVDTERIKAVTASTNDAAQRAAKRQANRNAELVASLPDELLADELTRRGWVCIPSS